MKVLVCEPDMKFGRGYEEGLQGKGHEVRLVGNGRDAQAELSNRDFEVTVMNIELSSFSAIEVIKFIRFKNIKTKVILLAESEQRVEACVFGKQNVKKLGIGHILTHPFSIDKLDGVIKGFFKRQSWKEIERNEQHEEVEVKAFDDKFTSIKIEEFFCGNMAIFDVYIRLAKNKYLKILNVGESMEQERLDNYRLNKGVTHLFFKTSDRKTYINFLNDLVKRVNDKGQVSDKTKLNFSENVTALMAQEVYTKGMDKETLEETLNVCESVHKTLEGMPSMLKLFTEYIEYEDTVEGHIYLTMIYADAIAQNIGWVTDHSRPKILLGAFLHDIGKIKLPRNLRGKKGQELSGKSLEEYKKHCKHGVELLDQIPEVGEQVKQIIYQHHELVNGEGFPNGFAGSKIYPLAKIVAFANRLAELSVSLGLPPYFIIKKLIQDKSEIFGYDPEVVKAFIKCFTPEKVK